MLKTKKKESKKKVNVFYKKFFYKKDKIKSRIDGLNLELINKIIKLDIDFRAKNKIKEWVKNKIKDLEQKNINDDKLIQENIEKIRQQFLVITISFSNIEKINYYSNFIKNKIYENIFEILEIDLKQLSFQIIFKITKNAEKKSYNALNSFLNLINNPKYNEKEHFQIILDIIEISKQDMFYVFNCLSSMLSNKSFSNQDIIDFFNIKNENNFWIVFKNIKEKSKPNEKKSFKSLSKLFCNLNFNLKNHFRLVKTITKKFDFEISYALNSLSNALLNKNFSNQDIIDFFNIKNEKNYWTIFEQVRRTSWGLSSKNSRYLSFNSLSKLFCNLNFNLKEHYDLLHKLVKNAGNNSYFILNSFSNALSNNFNKDMILDIMKNLKNEDLFSTLLVFLHIKPSLFLKTKYREKILNKISKENPEILMVFVPFLLNLYKNIYKTKYKNINKIENSQEFLDKMLFLDFILPLSFSCYISFFKKIKKDSKLEYNYRLGYNELKNKKLERIDQTILDINEKIKVINEKDIENNQEKNENSQYNLSNFHPLAILKIYDFLYTLQEEQEKKQNQKSQIKNVYDKLYYGDLVNLIINNIFLFKKIDNIFDFQRFTIEDLLKNNKEKGENEKKEEKSSFNLYEELTGRKLNADVLKDINLKNKGAVNE